MSQPGLLRIFNVSGELPKAVPSKPLLEVVESCHQEELLQEELGVQYSDVSCSANQGVGSAGQGMEHVVSNQSAVLGVHQRTEKVVDHLREDGSCKEGRRTGGGGRAQQQNLEKRAGCVSGG